MPVIEECTIAREDWRNDCLERLQRKMKMEFWQAKGKTLILDSKDKNGKTSK